MAWHDRLKFWVPREEVETTEVAAEADYPIETIEEEPTGQNWLMLVALVLAALAFAVLVVLAGRWAYNRSHSNKVSTGETVKQLPQGKNPTTAPASGSSNTGSTSSSSSANSAQPSGQSAGKSSATASSQQLPNSGPGDVVAIFALTSLAAAALHRTFTARRQSRI